jgi:serine/threonine protein kinase
VSGHGGDGSDDRDDSVDDFLRKVARVDSAEAPLPIVPADMLSGPPTVDVRRRLRISGPEALPVVDPSAYEILGEIARGGMGRILLAFDRRLGRRVAVKELLPGAVASAAERLVREALVTARLDHPGVVPVYEAGRWPSGVPFFAMKLVAGRSLAALASAAGNDREARRALVRHLPAACATVAFANARGVVHRDLKPGNLLVGDLGEVYVIDWGLARLVDAEVEASLPPARGAGGTSIVGTPGFQAPEQAAGETVDARADVYSLGVTLRALVGEARDFAPIVERATAPAVSARYPDAGALGEAIAAVLRAGGAVGPTAGGAPLFALTGDGSVNGGANDSASIAPPTTAPTVNEKRRPAPKAAATPGSPPPESSPPEPSLPGSSLPAVPGAPPNRRARVVLLVGSAALVAGVAGWLAGRLGAVPVGGAPHDARGPTTTSSSVEAPRRAGATALDAARAALARDPTEAVRRVKALAADDLPDPLRAEAQALVEEAARRGVARAEVRLAFEPDLATSAASTARPIALATDGATFSVVETTASGALVLHVGGVGGVAGAAAAPSARVALPPAPSSSPSPEAAARPIAVAISLDGRRAAVLAGDGRGATWSIDERPPRLLAPLACAGAHALALSADGALALCRGGGRARIVDTARGATVAELPTELVALSLDGALVATAPPPRPHRGAPAIAAAPAPLFSTAARPIALALAPRAAGGAVAALAEDGRLLVAVGDAPVRTLLPAAAAPSPLSADALAFTTDGAWLIAARTDGARLAALSDGHTLALAPVAGARLVAAASSPDGDTLALLDSAGRLRLYALDTLAAPTTHAIADARAFRRWLDELTALGPLAESSARQ